MNTIQRDDVSQNRKERITRREFLIGGVKVSLTFIALDAFPGSAFGQLASHAERGLDQINLTRPAAHLDDSLYLLAAYLVQYLPPTESFPATGAWKASYDLIEWLGSARSTDGRSFPANGFGMGREGNGGVAYQFAPLNPGPGFSRRNRRIGRLSFTRRPGDEGRGVSYELDYFNVLAAFDTRIPFRSSLKSTMQCSNAPIPGLLEWKTDYEEHRNHGQASPLRLYERGTCRDGLLEITTKAGTRRFMTSRPVAPQWAILDVLRGAKADAANPTMEHEFDLLHDLTSYRPEQRLKPCGVLRMSLDGRPFTFHGFLQTGIGTEPTHYWVDAGGRPLFVTGGLLSSALVAIESEGGDLRP